MYVCIIESIRTRVPYHTTWTTSEGEVVATGALLLFLGCTRTKTIYREVSLYKPSFAFLSQYAADNAIHDAGNGRMAPAS